MTLTEILKASNSFTDFMKTNFETSELEDIANYGADTGWQYLTYYSDTVTIYEYFKDDIWYMLQEDAENLGSSSIYELIASFITAKQVSSYTHPSR